MRLVWTARGRGDLARIWLFLAEHDTEVADRVTREIQARSERLADFPRIAPVVARNIRQWSIPKLGYLVTYCIADDHIRIVRVHHAREHRETP
ncbi:type II toxin-antitoxin system RelE/ParE family toxin [Sphingomonas sp.]|uniref:type II toxin-antitoxin system RelE/ParE family toxin n=1 Tax=Sphingomonas sp. TaxID=28214 RepID=UPI00333ED53B